MPTPLLRRTLRGVALVAALTLGVANRADAQRVATAVPTTASPVRPDSACRYERCALGIQPRWDGLAVVHGVSGARVANLHFFWPRDISAALAGPDAAAPGADSAAAAARRAVRIRRVGAALTDVGAALAATSVVAALGARRLRRGDALLAGAGATLVAISVPLQFEADGALSRAVWWHNARYAR